MAFFCQIIDAFEPASWPTATVNSPGQISTVRVSFLTHREAFMNTPIALTPVDRLIAAATLTGSLLMVQMSAQAGPSLAQGEVVSFQAEDLTPVESVSEASEPPTGLADIQPNADQSASDSGENTSILLPDVPFELPEVGVELVPNSCVIPDAFVAFCARF
jgi:hypothetical protein